RPVLKRNKQRALVAKLATKQLMLAVQFAQMPISQLEEDERWEVEHSVQQLIYRGQPPTPVRRGQLDPATLKELQAQSLRLLRDLANLRGGRVAIAND